MTPEITLSWWAECKTALERRAILRRYCIFEASMDRLYRDGLYRLGIK